MVSPESLLHQPGKLQMPAMPGLNTTSQNNPSNAFSGIRRAGQAKRGQDFAKFQGKVGADSAPGVASNASFDGSKYQNLGGQAKTQVGSMRQIKFS